MPTTNAPPGHSRCVCRSCGETFSGLTAFDKHRRGGRCLDPAELGMEIKMGAKGSWWGLPGNFRPRKGQEVRSYRIARKRDSELDQ